MRFDAKERSKDVRISCTGYGLHGLWRHMETNLAREITKVLKFYTDYHVRNTRRLRFLKLFLVQNDVV